MKKVVSILMMLILFVSVFSACNSEKTKISVYFKDAHSNSLNEEVRTVDAGKNADTAALAKLAVAELIEGPQNEQNRAVISKKAKLLSLVINDSVATVNMSKHFSGKSGVDGLILRFAFINTLCSIKGIDGIVIQVEGKPIISENTGKEYGVLSMDDIALNTEDKITVSLYFPDKKGEKLVKESRSVDAQNALSLEKTVISELIKGPEDSALSPSIPEGTKLLSIETKDSVCYVNFSSEFKSKTSSGSLATTMTLYSVINSLCEIDGVESVQILLDGENGIEFGNFVLDIPYEADNSLLQ